MLYAYKEEPSKFKMVVRVTLEVVGLLICAIIIIVLFSVASGG